MLLQVTLLMLTVGGALAYSRGPPVEGHEEICTSMFPGHRVEPMTNASPFEIQADTCYNENTTLNIQVKIITKGSTFYEGFFLMARGIDDVTGNPVNSSAYGTFQVDDDYEEEVQSLGCFSGQGNAAGHKKAEHYINQVVQWTSADDDSINVEGAEIKFVATFVREKEEVWMDVMTEAVAYMADCTTTISSEPIITSGASVSSQMAVWASVLSLLFCLVFRRY